MQIGILANRDSWYARDLMRAAEARGHAVTALEYARLCGDIADERLGLLHAGEPLDGLDAVVVRTMPAGSLEQVVFRMDWLHLLAESGVCVLNPPRSIECAVDKFLTTARLQQRGVPTPPTFACETAEAALAAFDALGGDVVVKPLFGSEGRGILRVSDPDLAWRVFRALERIGAVLYLQRFVEHGGCDVRILVLDGRVLASMRRVADDDFRTNIARNGTACAYQPTERESALALAAAEATGARLAGVDLLFDEQGCRVIEVNAVPGWRAIGRVTGIDVASAIVRALEHS